MKKHFVILAAIIVVISSGLVFSLLNVNYTPLKASQEAYIIDNLLNRLLVVAIPIFVLCMVTIIYSCIVFRRKHGDVEDGPPWHGHTPTEIVWTIIPLSIVMVFAVYGAIVLGDITEAPPREKELEVKVISFQWSWRFEYPEYGIASSQLMLPANRPVILRLHSTDVIHAFWVPEFRVKQDAVPGTETLLRITPTRLGDYSNYCAELCGLGHAYMVANVKVVETSAFDRWVMEQRR